MVNGITWNIHCNFLSSPLSNVPRQSSGKKEKRSQCAVVGRSVVIQHESRVATPDCLVRVEERLRGWRERRQSVLWESEGRTANAWEGSDAERDGRGALQSFSQLLPSTERYVH